MVFDRKIDRYLSNSPNNQLEMIKSSHLNYEEKNKNQMNQPINSNNQLIQYNQFNKMNQYNQLNNQTTKTTNQQVNNLCINSNSNENDSAKIHQDLSCDKANNVSNSMQNNNNHLLKDINPSLNLPILQQNKAIVYSDEENDEILESSPCGRWVKRHEQVEQHDIPNLDNSYLCIDGEEGIEVVWNEVRISERKNHQHNEARIHKVFNRLIQLNHNNIVKIHKYWLDKENPRLIFITEYMSGGTLRLFLKKTRSNLIQIKMTLMSWRRWCTQVLCALRYLHSQKPKPIVHGNLNCDTIFISHTGLIKIGCVGPDDIHQNVKTVGANTMANLRLLAPEIINENSTVEEINNGMDNGTVFSSPAVDIYAFGIVALEMAVLGIKNNFHCNNKQNSHQTSQQQQHRYSEGCIINQPSFNYLNEIGGSFVSKETIRKAIDLLDNELQKDFINKCLNEDPSKRPSAKELLFHPVIFEVPSLKVICANKILNNNSTGCSLEQIDEEFNRKMQNTKSIIGEIHYQDGTNVTRRICDLSKLNTEYLEKFFEEVRQGVYPLYAFQSPFKTKISKFTKIKRNSLKNNVDSNVRKECQLKLETLNGLRENVNKSVDNGEENEPANCLVDCNTNEEQDASNELNDENVECQEYEEEDYDQEDTGSQNEDYENRSENRTIDTYEEETRRIEQIEIKIKSTTSGQSSIASDKLYLLDLSQEVIVILLKLDDKMNRKLSCALSSVSDNGTVLANELVTNGFINSKDRELVELKINETMFKHGFQI